MCKLKTIKLIFSNSKKPLSPIIRAVTWSDYSHVGIISPSGGFVLESTLSLGGVKLATLEEFKARASEWEIVEFQVNDDQAIWAAACTQIGKKYDWTALVGIPLHRDWSEPDSWFCSELVAWAFEQGGTPLFTRKNISRVTPGHLYMIHPTRVYSV